MESAQPRAVIRAPTARLGDPHPSDLDSLATGDDALGGRAREPYVDQLDHHVDREAVCEHYRLGAAVAPGGEQLEGAAAVGLRMAASAGGFRDPVG
jgi:hypothetical protein